MRPEAATRTLENMIAPLLHFPWYQNTKEHWQGATFGIVSLGTLTRTPRCLVSDDERHLLAFEGELYNLKALQQEMGLTGLRGETAEVHTAVVMHALRRWGIDALARFNGLFQLALWDAHRQELMVSCDPGGLRPIYVAHDKEKFAFAPEVKALLVLPWMSREIDHQGILSFLRHGLPLGPRTFFQHVRVLPPGSCAVFRRGQLQIRRYWEMNFQEESRHHEKDIQQRFVETWTQVMHEQSEGDFRLGLPLSGGVDSRLILSALAAQEKEVFTFTMGHPECQDAAIAQQLASAAHCPNLFSPIVPGEVALGMERAVYVTDGMYNCFHANVRRLLPSLVETVSLVYDGITPLDSLYDPEDLYWRKWLRQTDAERWLHAEVDCDDVRAFPLEPKTHVDLINSEVRCLFQGLGEIDFLSEFVRSRQHCASGAVALVDRFWLEEYQHRFFAFGPQILRSAVEVRCPFFDKRMLELAGALLPIHRGSGKPLQRGAIKALTPALAAIPWERTGLPLTAGGFKTNLHRAGRAIRRKASNVVERRFGKAPKGSSAAKMVDFDEMIRCSPELQQRIESILIGQWRDGSRLFNRQSLQTLLKRHLRRAGNYAEIIGRVITVEMWHNLFIRETPRPARGHAQMHEQALRLAA
jgi:asparagine synthetase B (glutamine-hydrolysing)